METVIKSPELRRRGERAIKAHDDLHWIKDLKIKIGYCVSDYDKIANGRIVYAECVKVKALYHAYIPYDFIIVFYDPNTEQMSEDQLDILMYHELLHIDMDPGGKLKLRPHDVEEFIPIIDKYGLLWDEIADPAEPECGDLDGT